MNLNNLEAKSIYILREAKAQFGKLGVLWSGGKDSTMMLHLIKKAFYGTIPFPAIFIDTGHQFQEMHDFMEDLAEKWDIDLKIVKNDKYFGKVSPDKDHFECCSKLKTEPLKKAIMDNELDGIIASIRRDEHYMREIERTFSPRDKNFKWNVVREKTEDDAEGDSDFVSMQDTEMGGWDLYASKFIDANHVRIHPILHWSEVEIWQYIKKEDIPFNKLYLSKNGKRYRSLGCEPCTTPIKSDAKTIDEIIEELKSTKVEERSGRSQDKEMIMRRLRALGYM